MIFRIPFLAQVAELVDALVSGTSGAILGGSSPLLGTRWSFHPLSSRISVFNKPRVFRGLSHSPPCVVARPGQAPVDVNNFEGNEKTVETRRIRTSIDRADLNARVKLTDTASRGQHYRLKHTGSPMVAGCRCSCQRFRLKAPGGCRA